jgi:hypothetical protein
MNQLWVYQLLIYQHNIYIAQPNNYHQYVQPRDRFRDQTHQAELFRETHPKAIHVLIHHSTPDRFEDNVASGVQICHPCLFDCRHSVCIFQVSVESS